MRIFGLGMPELLVILAVVLLLFGPRNLPKLGNALGKTVKGLKEGMGSKKSAADADAESDEKVDVTVEDEEASEPAKKPAPKGKKSSDDE